MKVAEQRALVERLARARAWLRMTDEERQAIREQASADIDEIATSFRDNDQIAWMLLDPADEPADG